MRAWLFASALVSVLFALLGRFARASVSGGEASDCQVQGMGAAQSYEPSFSVGIDGNKVVDPVKPHLSKEKYSEEFKTVLVVGGDRGLGLALVTALKQAGVKVFATSRSKGSDALVGLIGDDVITNIDMADDNAPGVLVSKLKAKGVTKIETYIHNAGYFTTEGKALKELNRSEQRKMYEICAIAPVFIAHALLDGGLLGEGSKAAFITSEGGSIFLRTLIEGGGNYGHHQSKAANNMGVRLLAWDFEPHKVPVVAIHPGFMRTEMTADKYAHVYERFGAITPREVTPFILQCVVDLSMETSGRFVGATGSQGLGLGEVALPINLKYPAKIPPGGELPF